MTSTAERVTRTAAVISQCVSMYEASVSAVSATKSKAIKSIKAISNLF